MGDLEGNQMTENEPEEVSNNKPLASVACLESMKNYFNDTIQRNAFFLTGEWGCGKTHFIKNTLCEAIKNGEIGEHDEKQFKFIYISLDGVSDEESISRMVIYRMLNDKVETTVVPGAEILTQAVLNSAGEGAASKDLVKVAKKTFEGAAMKKIMGKPHVVVLDDLERCKMTIEETCGYVNRLIEGGNGNTKVVLVANEDKLPSWDTIKEKTVGMTIEFKSDFREVVHSIVDSADDELKKFMDKDGNYESFVEAFEECKYSNLRTAQAALSVIRKTAPILLAQKVKPECTQAIIESIAKSEIEYSKKEFELWPDGAQEYTSKMVNPVALRSAMGLPSGESDDVRSEQERHQFKFIEDYITSGLFDENRVSEIVCQFEFDVFPDEEKHPYIFALKRLKAFFEQDDRTIKKDIDKILEGVESKAISSPGNLAESLKALIEVKHLGFDSAEVAIAAIVNAVKSVPDEEVKDMHNAFDNPRYYMTVILEECKKEFQDICKDIADSCLDRMREKARSSFDDAWANEDWCRNVFTSYEELVGNPWLKDKEGEGFLADIDLSLLEQQIEDASVMNLSDFRRSLASLYNRHGNLLKLPNECSALSDLKDFFEKRKIPDESKMKEFNYVYFIKQIDGWLGLAKEPEATVAD